MNNKTNEKEFSVYVIQILRILKKYIALILAITVVAGVGAYIYTKNFIQPRYSASALIYVSVRDYSQIGVASSSDLTTAARLVSTYTIILKTDNVLKKVVEHPDVNGQISPGRIKGSLSTASVNDTEIFRITYTDTNPQRAWAVVCAIADVGPDAIIDVVGMGTAKAVEKPSAPPTEPYYPDVRRNVIMAAVIAFVISAAVFILISLLDNRIRTEEDLTETFGYPVFGSVPTIISLAPKETKDTKGTNTEVSNE